MFEDNYDEFSRLLNAKAIEQENKTKTLLAEIKKQDGESVKSSDLMKMTAKEQVDVMGISIKNELLQLFEDDRRLKNIRFTEVYNLIEQNKSLQTELINQ